MNTFAEITALPSLMCYGKSQEEARRALRLFADGLEKMRISGRAMPLTNSEQTAFASL